MSCASQDVKDLYCLLENEFLPLDLAAKVQPLLAKISKIGGKLASVSSVPEVQLSQYIRALENLAALRVLQQVLSSPYPGSLLFYVIVKNMFVCCIFKYFYF